MTKRRLALTAATLVVGVAVGVGVVASPAAAVPWCRFLQVQSDEAAMYMDEYLGNDVVSWNAWYDYWLETEFLLEEYGC